MNTITRAEAIEQKWIEAVGEKVFQEIQFRIGIDGVAYFRYDNMYEFMADEEDLFDKTKTAILRTFRPKSLRGIEDNNGWIALETEDDLPTENGYFHIIRLNEDGSYYTHHILADRAYVRHSFNDKKITHYRKVVDHPAPLHSKK